MILLWATSAAGTAGKDFEVDSSLARDRETRLTTAILLQDFAKPRWLLWLEGSS